MANKVNHKKSLYISIGIIAAVVGAIVWFWILPSIERIDSSISELQQQRAEIEQLKQQQTTDPQGSFAKYEDKAQKIESIVVTNESLIPFIEKIESIANSSNIEYDLSTGSSQGKTRSSGGATIDASPPPDQADPSKEGVAANQITLNLEVTGEFANAISVLKKIELMPTIVKMDEIRFSQILVEGERSNSTGDSDDEKSSPELKTAL